MSRTNQNNSRSTQKHAEPTRSRARLQRQPRFSPFIEGMEDRKLMAYGATLVGSVADFVGTDTATPLKFAVSGGFYTNNQFGVSPGFASPFDFDSATPGVQKLAANSSAIVNVAATGTGNGVDIDQSSQAIGLQVGFSTDVNPDTTLPQGNVGTSIGLFTYNASVTTLAYEGGSGGNAIAFSGNLPDTAVSLAAGNGNDTVLVNGVNNNAGNPTALFVDGQAGNDSIRATPAVTNAVAFVGGDGNDTLQGGASDDYLDGGNGDDTYLTSTGNDYLYDYGLSTDTNQVVVNGTVLGDNIQVDQLLRATDAVVTINVNGVISTNAVSGISVIQVYAGDGSDNVFATTALDSGGSVGTGLGVRMWLGQGNDFVDASGKAADAIVPITALGEAGNDTFIGGAGYDAFYGGADSDSYILNNPLAIGSYFEGDTGNNALYIQASNVQLFPDLSNVLHAVINGNTDPQLLSNNVSAIYLTGASSTSNSFDILDLSHTTVQTLTVQAALGGANSIAIQATQGDDDLRVDATVTPESLQVIGLPYYALLLNTNNPTDVLTLNGMAGNDSLEVTANNSAVINFTGGVGNDTLIVNPTSAGANFDGGDGNDLINVSGSIGDDVLNTAETAPGAIAVTLNGVTSTATSISKIVANTLSGNDTITANTLVGSTSSIDQTFDAGVGDDSIDLSGVNSGNIIARGGDGNDTLTGPAAATTSQLFGDNGNDLITGLAANDFIDGGQGNDVLLGGAGNDTLTGGSGNDALTGNTGDDNLITGGGADVVTWAKGDGNDFVDANGSQSTLVFAGDATAANTFSIYSVPGPAGTGPIAPGLSNLAYTSLGGDGSVTSTGLTHVSLQGGSGNDVFTVGNLQQTSVTLVDGSFGGGNNTANVYGTDAGDNIVVSTPRVGQVNINGLPALVRLFETSKAADTLNIYGGAGKNVVSITPAAADQIMAVYNGGDGDDYISGFSTVNGGGGNDTIYGTDGNDVIDGGDGNDLIFGLAGNDAINAGNGNDTVDGGDGNDQIWGLAGNDSILGGLGNDLIVAGTGNDTVDGGDGNDTIWGEAGNDSLLGGLGNDMIYGGDGNDFMLGGTPETANVKGKPRNPNLPNDGNDTMAGGNGFDRVDGGNGDNLLDAGADNIRETVLGGNGNDMMFTHQATEKNYDRAALDGGFQHLFKQGELSTPVPPAPPVPLALVPYTVPAFYYTGHIFYPNGNVVEQPSLQLLIDRGRTVVTTTAASIKKASVKATKLSAAKLKAGK